VGSVAKRRVAKRYSSPFRTQSFFDTKYFCTDRRYSSAGATTIKTLALPEREEISRGIAAGRSLRWIAASLGRAPSTVSREIKRNGGRRQYRAAKADQAAWDRAHRPKTCKLAKHRKLALIVAEKLQLEWSPDQIAGWLKSTYPDNGNDQVSHETIYKTLFIQARGALKKELIQYLRKPRAMRRSRHHTQKTKDHGRISNTVSIRERPAEVEDRAVPGWLSAIHVT
jgi:IS30 family transposase